MPRAADLEEFGLEVEHENHALISENNSRLGNTTRRSPLDISTPSKEQRSLLQSINTSPSRLPLRPGMLKWASLVIVLAVIVFLNIGQESEETMEDMMTPEDLEAKQKSGLVLGGKDDGWIEDNDRYHIFGKDGDNVGTENVNVIDEHSVQHSDEQVAVEESKVQESTTDIKQNNGPADESKEDGEVEVESEEKEGW
eukprot:g10114.t1 g10114   contig4:1247182-1247772(-)